MPNIILYIVYLCIYYVPTHIILEELESRNSTILVLIYEYFIVSELVTQL